ncbi:MAG: SEL1-like repeat protein, partial [Candidatus Binatia bacterium]
AQNGLGKMYSNGQGAAKDYVQAHMWYNLAAAQGHEASKSSRGFVEKLMSRKQIAEAQRLAAEWTEKHSRKVTGEK